MMRIAIPFLLLMLSCCNNQQPESNNVNPNPTYFLGADLSYINEMENCGAVYHNSLGQPQDPYVVFSQAGANLVRLRLWHSPVWTNYSNLEDVKKSIRRSKKEGMKVLLAFHYSDDWADPYSQDVPEDWLPFVDDITRLSDALYSYTYDVLKELHSLNLLPDIVQVGNEINAMILQRPDELKPIEWKRNATLLNRAIKAVRDFTDSTVNKVEVMLHIAQPENALWWFNDAKENGVVDFDFIGISYYPKWSNKNLQELGGAITTLKNMYHKEIIIVETAYPFTLDGQDEANNILGQDSLEDEFPATQDGQLAYLNALHKTVKDSGGSGVLYWEPAWVSTSCATRWGKGSHWENATLFDFFSKPTKAMLWFRNRQE